MLKLLANMKFASLYILASLLVFSSAVVRYDNYTLYKLYPKSTNDLEFLQNLQKSKEYKLDFWNEPSSWRKFVNVLVSPKDKYSFEYIIGKNNINFEVITDNIQERIDEEFRVNKLTAVKDGDLTWDKYYDLQAINDWLEKLANDHPDKVTLIKGGKSYENRDIIGVKVSFGPKEGKRSVWLDSQIHAREWISGATTTYILNEVLHSEDPRIRAIAEGHDWYIFPVINPDGFEFTHTTDRMWRKTRTDYGKGQECRGADPNRNWDFKWNQGGSTDDPCDETYAGPTAFSEVETKTLSEYMSTVVDELLLFITFHSFSELILLPYGYTSDHLDNYNVTYPVAVKGAKALAERYGTDYYVGDIVESGIGIATGSNMDWVKGVYHVPFAYAYELRDQGRYGFILPPEQIIPNSLEVLDSLLTILEEADKVYQN
ncbi:unnamed protein product [Diabrotica balteata]|uniref:Zinc carboxypeptidase A 1 n=1 Tax=Diabrotica balteata TaxID=107213 RepID=A0A9N9XEF3_DIABA|nr:unnamed protein product [Diabrotica balteata]